VEPTWPKRVIEHGLRNEGPLRQVQTGPVERDARQWRAYLGMLAIISVVFSNSRFHLAISSAYSYLCLTNSMALALMTIPFICAHQNARRKYSYFSLWRVVYSLLWRFKVAQLNLCKHITSRFAHVRGFQARLTASSLIVSSESITIQPNTRQTFSTIVLIHDQMNSQSPHLNLPAVQWSTWTGLDWI